MNQDPSYKYEKLPYRPPLDRSVARTALRETGVLPDHRDPLTQLLDRRGYGDAVVEKYDLQDNSAIATVMTFIDIDNFGGINEQYGHAVGDRAVVQMAGTIAAQMRPEDTILRFGGDEFVVVWDLPNELSDEEKEEIIRRKEYKLQVGLGIVSPNKEGASRGSVIISSPSVEDLTISNGGENDEGGLLFRESRSNAYKNKEERKHLTVQPQRQ